MCNSSSLWTLKAQFNRQIINLSLFCIPEDMSARSMLYMCILDAKESGQRQDTGDPNGSSVTLNGQDSV